VWQAYGRTRKERGLNFWGKETFKLVTRTTTSVIVTGAERGCLLPRALETGAVGPIKRGIFVGNGKPERKKIRKIRINIVIVEEH